MPEEEKKDVAPAEVAPPEAPKVDLDAEQDARCAPVAQGILEDMANSESVSDKSQFAQVIMGVLKRALDANLNVAMDNPFVFQILLKAVGAFNNAITATKMTPLDDARYGRIAHELLKVFASAHVPMGNKVTEDQIKEALAAVQPQFDAIFEREKLNTLEVRYILEGVLKTTQTLQGFFTRSIEESVDRMEEKILQIGHKTELTMGKLDDILKTDIDTILERAGVTQQKSE
jgi:hypothetical protein